VSFTHFADVGREMDTVNGRRDNRFGLTDWDWPILPFRVARADSMRSLGRSLGSFVRTPC